MGCFDLNKEDSQILEWRKQTLFLLHPIERRRKKRFSMVNLLSGEKEKKEVNKADVCKEKEAIKIRKTRSRGNTVI